MCLVVTSSRSFSSSAKCGNAIQPTLSLSLFVFFFRARAYLLNYDNNERQISENNRPVKDARTTLYYCREAEERRAFGVYFLQCGSGALKIPSLSFLFNKSPLAGSCPRLSSISRHYPAMLIFRINCEFAGDITQSRIMNNLLSKRSSLRWSFCIEWLGKRDIRGMHPPKRYLSRANSTSFRKLENLIRTFSEARDTALCERISDIYNAAAAARKNRRGHYKHLHIIGSIFVLAPAAYSLLRDTCALLIRYSLAVPRLRVSRLRTPSLQSVLEAAKRNCGTEDEREHRRPVSRAIYGSREFIGSISAIFKRLDG